ncbi:MAG: class II aldolase/adducin family protein [bacterium]
MEDRQIREQIVGTCRALYQRGLNMGYAGNISFRQGDSVWITPAARPKHRISPEEVVQVSVTGQPMGSGRASSEGKMHYAIYRRRPEVQAIVHAHPPFLSITAVTSIDWPPLLPEMEIVIGPPAIIPYLPPGTDELAERVAMALDGALWGILLNHGAVALADSLEGAFDYLEMGESLAHTLVLSRLVGSLHTLPPGERARFGR